MARVLAIGDSPQMQQGLRKVLEAQPGSEGCGEAADGLRAVSQAAELNQDLVVLKRTIPARVLIVDDHAMVRIGVRTMLAGHPQFEVCGEATDGRQALAKVAELVPDVVILDLLMPIMNGFEAAAEIRRISPSTKIVLFSLHEIPAAARLVAADAYVAKSATTELIHAIEYIVQLRRAAGGTQ